MIKYYDIHCHVFNKSIINNRIINLFIPLLDLLDSDKKGHLLNTENVEHVLNRLDNFLSAFLKDRSEDVFKILDNAYNNAFVFTPLMFDLTYADDNYGTRLQNLAYKERREIIIDWLEEAIKVLKLKSKLSPEVEEKLDALMDPEKGKIKSILNLREDVFNANNFEQQIKDLEDLSQNDRVKPFFSIDPRRYYKGHLNLINLIQEKVLSPDAKFIGVKLYAPAGFSPTDPILYGTEDSDEGVYKFCMENKIPITVHCSDSGFACTSRFLKVRGHINQNDSIKFYKDFEKIKFRTKFFSIKAAEAIKERAEVLNHPKLWNIVLKRFPELKLNLAHFGGSNSIMEYVNYVVPDKIKIADFKDMIEALDLEQREIVFTYYTKKARKYEVKDEILPKEKILLWNVLYHAGIIDNWSKAIFDIINNPKYKNVYTDLSCFSEGKFVNGEYTIKHQLTIFKSMLFDNLRPDVKNKILYGSDFFFCLMFGPTMENYIKEFRNVFKDDFDTIANVNPERFLN